MKKIIALLLVAVMAMSLVACSDAGDTTTTGATNTTTQNAGETTGSNNETTGDPTVESITEELPACNTATAVLRAAWDKYAEEQKFYPMGGDYDNLVEGAGDVPLASEFLTSNMLVPAEQTANIAEAGSLLHGMMPNNFTCGAYKLVEGADETAFVTAMQTAIQGNQWVCGFPETLLVMKADGILVVAFGNGEIISTFKTNLTAAYAEAEVVIEEAIGG